MSDLSMEKTLEYAGLLKQHIIKSTANGQHVHAETIIAAAGQMAGTMIFRSFITSVAATIPAGTVVLSEQANTLGPRFMNLMLSTVKTLEPTFDEASVAKFKADTKLSHFKLLEIQEKIGVFYDALAKEANLTDLEGARIFAIVAGMLINQCKGVYNIYEGCQLAIYGMVEGSKTMPKPRGSATAPSPAPAAPTASAPDPAQKPWYRKLW